MPDIDEELGAFLDDAGWAPDDGVEADEVQDEVPDTAEARRAALQAVIDEHPGTLRAQLSSELLVAMQEREEKAERDKRAADAVKLLEEGGADFDNPITQANLLAQVEVMRSEADLAYLKTREAEYAAKFGEETAAEMMKGERARLGDVAWWFGAPDLNEVPAYRAKVEADVHTAVARQAAAEMLSRSRSLEDDAAEAQAGIDAMLAEVAA